MIIRVIVRADSDYISLSMLGLSPADTTYLKPCPLCSPTGFRVRRSKFIGAIPGLDISHSPF